MDLKHLQALIGIAECGSFSAAADSIGTVQSNISAHIARLERELDVVLVDRATGRLTEEGEVVVARARRMMAELDAMAADVVSLRQEVSGTVRAGMIGTTGRWLVPQLFARLREQHPHVRLNVTDGSNTTLEPQVVTGQLDLAVVSLPVRGEELVVTPLFDEDLMLVVPADHPLALAARQTVFGVPEDSPLSADDENGSASAHGQPNDAADTNGTASTKGTASTNGRVGTNGAATHRPRTDPLPISALADLELLLPMPGTVLRNEIDAVVGPTGVTLHPSIELDGVRMLASLTFDGYGPSILPAAAVPEHLRSQFRLLPLQGFPRRGVGIVLRSRGMPSAPTRVLIDVLHETVRDSAHMPGLHPVGSAHQARASMSRRSTAR